MNSKNYFRTAWEIFEWHESSKIVLEHLKKAFEWSKSKSKRTEMYKKSGKWQNVIEKRSWLWLKSFWKGYSRLRADKNILGQPEMFLNDERYLRKTREAYRHSLDMEKLLMNGFVTIKVSLIYFKTAREDLERSKFDSNFCKSLKVT